MTESRCVYSVVEHVGDNIRVLIICDSRERAKYRLSQLTEFGDYGYLEILEVNKENV